MKRSFAEVDSMKHEVDRKEKLQQLQDNAKLYEGLMCGVCYTDIDQYYQACAAMWKLHRKSQVCLGSYQLPPLWYCL